MMFFKVKVLQNSKYNVFRSKERTNKVPPNIFGGFEVRKKGTIDVFTSKGRHER